MKMLLGVALALAPVSAYASTTANVGYDAAAPEGNFGTPTNVARVDYSITSSQDAERLYVTFNLGKEAPASAVIPAANIYFSNGVTSFLGFEITNNRAFRPTSTGQATYYDLTGTGFTYSVTGSAAAGDLAIAFETPFSFFRDDPLGMGFAPVTGAAGNDFLRISLSQAFSYSVAGGSSYGRERLGAFTVPAAQGAVPEPATWALMILGFGVVGYAMRRRTARVQLA